MEQPSLEGNTRTLQALIRRLKVAVPHIRTLSGSGWAPDVLSLAADREGLLVVSKGADAEVYLSANNSFELPISSGALVVGVIAREVGLIPLHLYQTRPARRYVTLRQWVESWFPQYPALSRLLVSSAVQDRYSANRWKEHSEWIFVREKSSTIPRGGWSDRWKYLLVTGGGSGAFPIMPATVASLFMLPFGLGLYWWVGFPLSAWIWMAVAILATVGCVLLEKWAARWFLADDPKEFVLDEVAGLALAWALLPPTASYSAFIWAFVLFRIFDIFKWGVNWVEKVPFRGRVVWDDLLAGLYAGILVWLAIFIA